MIDCYACCDKKPCDIFETKMKIKMPCKLCEMSLDQQKMSSRTTSCNHILDYASPYVPFSLEQLAMQSNGLLLPQMRDMMLAACLLRGEEQEEERLWFYASAGWERENERESCILDA